MIRVGITGQSGFIGTHLYNKLSIDKSNYQLIPFSDDYFDNDKILTDFVSHCDVIVHLAAVNRHHNPDEIYSTNILLVEKLIAALNKSGNKAKIIFASSTQEVLDNVYGKSKKEARERLALWARENKTGFTGLVIPNVFGPFGKPFFNSVISTFSYQLCNDQTPKLEIDAELRLIYIGELVSIIEKIIQDNSNWIKDSYDVPHTAIRKVSNILKSLNSYKSLYFDQGIIPDLSNTFEINLFNTFRSYIDLEKHFPFKYKVNKDERGIFVEILKQKTGGQVSYSTTKPDITRGNHFHTRKIERFAVIKGKALIKMRKYGTDKVFNFELNSDEPSFVDMPVWYTHNITNIGDDELVTFFLINEFYDPDDPDTYIGTRPEIIRLSRVIAKLDKSESIHHILVHTGQNYDYELNQIFFEDLKIRKPDYFLKAAGKNAAETIGQVIIKIDPILEKEKPDAFLVLGDTNSCLCTIPAKKRHIPIFHMEAGNRCFDQRVPEEINRKIVDHISDINLTYSDISRAYLLREGLLPDRIIKTGSPLYEVLNYYKPGIEKSQILKSLKLKAESYFLLSSHREDNIETENFSKLINLLNWLTKTYKLPVIVSTHPRTKKMIAEKSVKLNPLVRLMKPVGFLDYNLLQLNAKVVLSDSGTISEESSILNFPALNIREAHERPEAMEEASVMLTGFNLDRIEQALNILEIQGRADNRTLRLVNDYAMPNVSEKIVRIIISYTDYIKRVVWQEKEY